ncbi:hypothetical protein JHK87_047597 [Glycine soja]|nr:hypothetical protein JHK87_047597 [Glycine soja]
MTTELEASPNGTMKTIIQPPRSLPSIIFTDRDLKGINPINQDDFMVVFIAIACFMVSKVLIDQGNSTDILYWKTFRRLEISPTTIQPHYGPLLVLLRKEWKLEVM